MQLLIRGNETYLVEASSVAELKAQVFEKESCEDILFYVSGKPLTEEVELVDNATVDITVPLKGGKVRFIIPAALELSLTSNSLPGPRFPRPCR